jgi:MerR family transcriptional regulator/heat shock protein HspR
LTARSLFPAYEHVAFPAVMDDSLPVYIISSAANILSMHPRTLYSYEEKGLLVPVRKGNRRFYSANDLQWISAIRYLVHTRGINLEGIRRLLAMRALFEYKRMYRTILAECQEFVEPTSPCWTYGIPEQYDCYQCPIYRVVRNSLCSDEDVPEFTL